MTHTVNKKELGDDFIKSPHSAFLMRGHGTVTEEDKALPLYQLVCLVVLSINKNLYINYMLA